LQHAGLNKPSSVQKQVLSEGEKIEFTRLFFNANKEKILGNYNLAASHFSECIRKDPSNAAAMYELAKAYVHLKKYEESLFFARKAAAINPNNVWYQLFLAEAYRRLKLFNDAVNVYKQLVKDYPDRFDYYYEWATMLMNIRKYTEAIKVYDKIEEKVGVVEDISFQKERLYIKLNKIDKAIQELEKLIEAYPKDPKYYGMLAELYHANGINDKALKIYNYLLEADPENSLVHLSLADYYRSIDEKEKSFNELKIAFGKTNLDIDTKVSILLSYYEITESYPELKEQALTLCNILTATHPDDAKSHSIYGDFLVRDHKFEESRKQFRLAIELEKDKFVIWKQLLRIEYQLRDFEALLEESEEAIELFPNQALLYLFKGIANINLEKHQEALEALNDGVNRVVQDDELLGQFYSNLGDTYHTKKDTTASDQAYDKALEADSENIYVLNNYSYYLSLRSEELKRAKEMSKKANTIAPNNVAFQDTYGWILYQLGNYSKAKIWLEKSIENGGDKNSVILEHYGDLLFKLGKKEKALEYWEKAKVNGKGSELLDRKIKDKQLYD